MNRQRSEVNGSIDNGVLVLTIETDINSEIMRELENCSQLSCVLCSEESSCSYALH